MKFSTTIAMATLATTGLAAHRQRHARFHDAKREAEIIEFTERALAADPTLAKRCGEMVNSGQWGSFPMCWGVCEGSAECGGSNGSNNAASAPAAPAAQASTPAAAPAESPAASPAAANVKVNAAAPGGQGAAKSSAAPTAPKASPSSSSSSSDSTGKIGLAYNDPSLITGEWLNGDASWGYNWGFQSGNLNSKIAYVPMFHDNSQLSAFQGADFSSYDYLLSLNEPDMPSGAGGSDLSPQDACTAHTNAFKNLSGKKISSPAVSSQMNTAGKGLEWLKSFKAACPDAQVDFVPLHYYGGGGSGASQGADFLKYVETAKSTVNDLYPGKQIWWTEFAATPVSDASVNADFLDAVLPSLKSDSAIGRIAPFMVGSGGALGTNTPNAAGKVLIATS